jgi:hypothetical protein
MKELFDAVRVKEAAAEGFEAFGRGSLYALEKLESEVFGVEAAVAELQARERAAWSFGRQRMEMLEAGVGSLEVVMRWLGRCQEQVREIAL